MLLKAMLHAAHNQVTKNRLTEWQEAAAKLVPILGAPAGGSVNYLFMHHYQEMARGHFIVKRIEKKYGTELTRQGYETLAF